MRDASRYVLGHSAREWARPGDQGVILRPVTDRLLRDAGIGPGMTVLDAGCGTGDVTRCWPPGWWGLPER